MAAWHFANEADRLADLESFAILDTAPDAGFDRLLAATARRFHAPIAAISLIDARREWFLARIGIAVPEIPRYPIAGAPVGGRAGDTGGLLADRGPSPSVLVISDLAADPDWTTHPLVLGDPGLCMFAGAQLIAPSGHILGRLWIMDRIPRPDFDAEAQAELAELAALVVDRLNLGRSQHLLVAARSEADANAAARSQFLEGLARDLRPPLAGLSGMLDQLLQCPLDDTARRYAAAAQHSAAALGGLLHELTDLATAPGLDPASTPLEPAGLIASVVSAFAPAAAAKGVALGYRIDPALPHRVVGAPQQLTRLLFAGLSSLLEHAAGRDIALAAIGAADAREAFALLLSADAASPEALASLADELDRHGFATEATPAGVRISVTLPVLAGPLGAAPVAASAPAAPPLAGGARLLLLLADPAQRTAIETLARGIGLNLHAAGDLAAAVAALKANPPDLLLCAAAEGDATAVLAALRALPRAAGVIPALALIPADLDPIPARDAALAMGFDSALTLPLESGRLRAALDRWVNPPPGLDGAVLAQLRRDTGDAVATDLLTMFLTEADQRLARMLALAADDDRAQLAREAHALHSTAGAFGARRVAELADGLAHQLLPEGQAGLALAVRRLARAGYAALAVLSTRLAITASIDDAATATGQAGAGSMPPAAD